MAAIAPETKIVRNATIVGGAVDKGSGYVWLTVKLDDGDELVVQVNADTASKFHCGKIVTVTINVP